MSYTPVGGVEVGTAERNNQRKAEEDCCVTGTDLKAYVDVDDDDQGNLFGVIDLWCGMYI